ncbi:MAG: calcium-binding protein [Clostridiales bacterium]|jgi:hypothetical protein|nr:calcium-binding protein [Clostridiales bacterium]
MQDIEFNGEFEDEPGLCSICGGDSVLTGWNEENDLCRFECTDCGSIIIVDSEYNETILKGEKRDWVTYLKEHLVFPFDARIDEVQGHALFEEGPLRYGDKVVVKKISGEFGMHNIIADIKKGTETFRFPLCDLAAEDKKSPNHYVLDHYRTWSANC